MLMHDARCMMLHPSRSYICENSQHTKFQPPTMLRSVLTFFGQTKLKNKRNKFTFKTIQNDKKESVSGGIIPLQTLETID